MPLAYTVDQPLQPIPVDQFNADGIAVVMVSGGRYGGQWVMDAYVDHDNPDAQPIGSIETTPDDRPSMAVDTAYVWMNDPHPGQHRQRVGRHRVRMDERRVDQGWNENRRVQEPQRSIPAGPGAILRGGTVPGRRQELGMTHKLACPVPRWSQHLGGGAPSHLGRAAGSERRACGPERRHGVVGLAEG